MSSSILYKFRSGTTFEALPLPGSAARLLDIKKAIVTAKKLDHGSMDFDLSVKDASSGVEYQDESALLPRGTRLVVHRLPAQRGQGILAKIARSQYGGGGAPMHPQQQTTPSDFYTIDSRAHDEDEEFVSSSTAIPPPPPPPPPPAASSNVNKEEQELAALRAVTETAAAVSSATSASSRSAMLMRGGRGGGGPAGSGPPPQPRAGNHQFHSQSSSSHQRHHHHHHQRPNADPELREQETQIKKRPTGIPRTFQSLSAPPNTTGEGGGVAVPQIQPNTIGFNELVQRGGGQSETAAGTKRNLEYAIKVTATTVPEYLQCAICHGVVRDAMMLPWDPEGRTTCERCIRDALTQNGFRCPLTQQEGVSPDDLLPNHALRKAAEQFVQDVMQKIQEIDEQAKLEEEILPSEAAGGSSGGKVLEGDKADSGVVLTRRASAADQKRKKEEEDPFCAGEDEFGGDIFAVAAEENPDEEVEDDEAVAGGSGGGDSTTAVAVAAGAGAAASATEPETENAVKTEEVIAPVSAIQASDASSGAAASPYPAKVKSEPTDTETNPELASISSSQPVVESAPGASNSNALTKQDPVVSSASNRNYNDSRRDDSSNHHSSRRRGPPAGYAMGPAGGAVGGPVAADTGGSNTNNTSTNERAPPPPAAQSPRDTPSMELSHDDRSYRGGGFRGSARGGDGRGRNGAYSGARYDSSISRGGGRGGRFYQDSNYNAARNDHQYSVDNDDRGVKRSRSASQGPDDDNSSMGDQQQQRYRADPRDGGRGQGRGGPPPFRGRGGYRGGGGGRGYWEDRGGRGGFRGRGGYRGRGRY